MTNIFRGTASILAGVMLLLAGLFASQAFAEESGNLLDGNVQNKEVVEEGLASLASDSIPVHFDWHSADGGDIAEGDSATFSITGDFTDGQVKELIIDGHYFDGVRVTGFVSGESYVLSQKRAPRGHAAISKPIAFTIRSNGADEPAELVISEGEVDDYKVGRTTSEDASNSPLLTIVNRGLPYDYKPIGFALKKVDESGNPLEGAEFTLSGMFMQGVPETQAQGGTAGYDEVTAKTNSKGEAVFSHLLQDVEYQLVEKTAPSGYKAFDAVPVIKIGSDGKATIEGNAAPEYASTDGSSGQEGEEQMKLVSVSDDGATVTVVNQLEKQVVSVEEESGVAQKGKTTANPAAAVGSSTQPIAKQGTASTGDKAQPVLVLLVGVLSLMVSVFGKRAHARMNKM